jgi:hypothetical protein
MATRYPLVLNGTTIQETQAGDGIQLPTALAIAYGGTGQTTAGTAFNALSPVTTAGDLIVGNGVNTATRLAIGTNGDLLTVVAGAPAWAAAPAAGVTSFAGGSTGLTPASATTGAISLAGTLAIANGGTGQTTLAAANIPVVNAANTFTATQTFSGSSSAKAIVLNDAAEVATVSATQATGTIDYFITTQSVLYYTSNASANWTVNFRGSAGTSLNTIMADSESMTVAFLVTQGTTAFYNSAVQIEGTTSGVTTRWFGGAPAAGNASGIDSYRYLIIKTGSATFTVLASVTQFKA